RPRRGLLAHGPGLQRRPRRDPRGSRSLTAPPPPRPAPHSPLSTVQLEAHMRSNRLRRAQSMQFEGIGVPWEIEAAAGITERVQNAILQRVGDYDRVWSRFRADSLVSRIAREPGQWRLP